MFSRAVERLKNATDGSETLGDKPVDFIQKILDLQSNNTLVADSSEILGDRTVDYILSFFMSCMIIISRFLT